MKTALSAAIGLLAATLGASATLITQEQVFSGTPNWTQNLAFDQFNPQLGVLNSVDLTLLGSVQVATSIQNTSAGDISFSLSDDFTLGSTVPSGSPVTLTKQLDQSFGVPYQQTAAQTASGTATLGRILTGDLSSWVGQGTVNLSASASDTYSERITGGNFVASIDPTAELDATVVYDYTAVPDNPLPASVALVALGVVCWLAAKRQPLGNR
jgi:hypothetical protein